MDNRKRASFYTSHSDCITYFLLNTNGHERHKLDKSFAKSQYKLLKAVYDTIANSSHFIILSHHSLWQKVDVCGKTGSHLDTSNYAFKVGLVKDFYKGVYKPLFKKVQKRGVEVIFFMEILDNIKTVMITKVALG